MPSRKPSKRDQDKRQASAVISVTGIICFTIVEVVSQFLGQALPLYVYCIFIAIIVPPEMVKRVLRALVGSEKDE